MIDVFCPHMPSYNSYTYRLYSTGQLGQQAQDSLQTVRPRRYSQNLNVSVLCPLPPNFGLSRVYDSITLTDKTPKTGKISTKTCRSIQHTGLPIILDRLKISATGSLALTQYRGFFNSDRYIYKKTCIIQKQ